MEIGGYIEFPDFTGNMLHEGAISLNSARNCLAYLIEAKNITRICLPQFLCAAVEQICKKYEVRVRYYSIGYDFLPKELKKDEDEWLYLVNYYGQLDNSIIEKYKKTYDKLIVDNAQAYFQMPLENVDTIYTCRKFFGVPDGAFLYTDTHIQRALEQDRSSKRMEHLLGRYEQSAGEYYSSYIQNENIFESLPLMKMSKLTCNLLHGIDYEAAKSAREQNFSFLQRTFSKINRLTLKVPQGAFMYPLYAAGGMEIRKRLQSKGIYIPVLWPDVLKLCDRTEPEYDMAENILPLPCDQRYDLGIMNLLAGEISEEL